MLDAVNYGNEVIGPVVYEYISWLLYQAHKRKLKTLYFLARDGYLLKQVAELLCIKKGYHIQCKYLYCSRMSLRMPTYHFIGGEAYDLLLQGGYHITPYILMRRLGLNSEERNNVYSETGVTDETRALTPTEFQILIEKLKISRSYNEYIDCKSTASYADTIGYFRQEGLFQNSQIAIVDSGWSGSMQRSLRQLLEHEGYNGKIVGFYFGLYNEPKEKKDGEYKAYYFNVFCNLKNKVYFDNTFFECMLSAPHGMTIGFNYDGITYHPVLKKDMNENLTEFIQAQIHGALQFAEQRQEVDYKGEFAWKKSVKKVYKILKRAVLYPSKDEIEAYSNFKFCDDVSEDFSYMLIQKDMLLQLKNYMLLPKIIAKMKHKDNVPISDLFWPYGVITYIKYPMQFWYRWNIISLQCFRYIRTNVKEKRRVSKS